MNLKVDIAYILGGGSKWDNRELKFSLRSVEKYLPFKKVFVCGNDPGFLSESVTFIENHPIQKANDKAWAIKEQLLKLCSDDRLSEDFVLLNDDYFFLRPVTSFPYWHKGELKDAMETLGSGVYYGHLLATERALFKKRYTTLHFDGHWPIVYNKKKLVEVIQKYNWNIPLGYTLRSLYCNTLGIPGEYREDVKANKPEDWELFTRNKDVFSVDDQAIGRNLGEFLLTLFPNKSQFEK